MRASHGSSGCRRCLSCLRHAVCSSSLREAGAGRCRAVYGGAGEILETYQMAQPQIHRFPLVSVGFSLSLACHILSQLGRLRICHRAPRLHGRWLHLVLLALQGFTSSFWSELGISATEASCSLGQWETSESGHTVFPNWRIRCLSPVVCK